MQNDDLYVSQKILDSYIFLTKTLLESGIDSTLIMAAVGKLAADIVPRHLMNWSYDQAGKK
jgi:hypothetical protein